MNGRTVALAFAALFTIGATPGAAQDRVAVGLRGGVSVASASFDDDTFDASNRTGFVGGPFVNLDFGPLGFQLAGLYNSKGFETATGDLDLGYIEIPAVLKVGIPLEVIKPSVFAGAAFAVRTTCSLDGVDCADDDFERTDFSGVVGVDLAVYLGDVSLWADARYNVGLGDINDANDVFGDLSTRNWNLTAGVGIQP